MIARLRDSWTREGPGVPKDMPPKTGLALLGATIRREAWDLFMLNLLVAISSLAIITIPAAHAAGARVAQAMLRDQPIYLLRDYMQAFRALFWRASGLGGAAALLVGLAGYGVYIYGQLALHSVIYTGPAIILLAAALFFAACALQAVVMMSDAQDTRGGLLRRAAAITLASPLHMPAAMATVAALWLAHLMFYPVSVFLPAVANFSLGVLLVTFAALSAKAHATSRATGRPASATQETR
ncbi:DUF624 domain-containing protein [Rhodobacteraceae bacterium]|nr:DUF624 domain-containing protein [Paracoccaceae bacterium]